MCATEVSRKQIQLEGEDEFHEKDSLQVNGHVCPAASVAAFAQSGDNMKQDEMKQDNMKQDQMKKDDMKKDKKSKKTKKDHKKDEMKKDDTMKKDDGMQH